MRFVHWGIVTKSRAARAIFDSRKHYPSKKCMNAVLANICNGTVAPRRSLSQRYSCRGFYVGRRQRRTVVRFSDNGPLMYSRLLDVVAFSLWSSGIYRCFRKCGEIGNLRAQTDFRQQNRRSRKSETVVWSADLGFPRFRNRSMEVCGKFRNPRAHRLFQVKKQQVEALPLSSVVVMSRICRILPDWALI